MCVCARGSTRVSEFQVMFKLRKGNSTQKLEIGSCLLSSHRGSINITMINKKQFIHINIYIYISM